MTHEHNDKSQLNGTKAVISGEKIFFDPFLLHLFSQYLRLSTEIAVRVISIFFFHFCAIETFGLEMSRVTALSTSKSLIKL